jgi:hypothetical protein
MNCHYCDTTKDVRPYGPRGSGICFDCMQADPEREKAAAASFQAQMEAAEAMSPIGAVVINLGNGGPQPLIGEDLRPE